MVSTSLAQQLKSAGLEWKLNNNDFFHIPDRDFDDRVFVVTDMTVLVEKLHGNLAVTFHGTVEWALDHVLVAELVWLPSESQLREELEKNLVGEPEPSLTLISTTDGYRCEICFKEKFLAFEGFGVSDVYAMALLYVLKNK
ncbi:MAG: pilus assembly protein CpaE [Anaerolineae bacterium]|nr:pilus assembly protein CpaE [Anaerolineae bacterium]